MILNSSAQCTYSPTSTKTCRTGKLEIPQRTENDFVCVFVCSMNNWPSASHPVCIEIGSSPMWPPRVWIGCRRWMNVLAAASSHLFSEQLNERFVSRVSRDFDLWLSAQFWLLLWRRGWSESRSVNCHTKCIMCTAGCESVKNLIGTVHLISCKVQSRFLRYANYADA